MSYKVKSPILFIIFNRPHETEQVFEAIRKAQPKKLYIAADGPRLTKKEDLMLCQQTRDIIKNVDWDCEVKTLLRDENLGCKKAVSEAITWFFDNEPEGIILEDDCLPNIDFFMFMDQMLEYYRYNDKVAHICGCNFQDGIKRGLYSYYFSNITHVWGWAGWRRVWIKYDVHMSMLNKAIKKDFLSALTDSKINKLFLETSYKKVVKGHINTWDYQYGFLNLLNNMVSVIPNNNMLSNIGFNKNGTHTLTESVMADIPFEPLILPLKHPDIIITSKEADEYTLKKEVPKSYKVILTAIKFFVKEALFNK